MEKWFILQMQLLLGNTVLIILNQRRKHADVSHGEKSHYNKTDNKIVP